jgi:hypothetical protein
LHFQASGQQSGGDRRLGGGLESVQRPFLKKKFFFQKKKEKKFKTCAKLSLFTDSIVTPFIRWSEGSQNIGPKRKTKEVIKKKKKKGKKEVKKIQNAGRK